MFIATLVAADRPNAGDFQEAADRLAEAGLTVGEIRRPGLEGFADIAGEGDVVTARKALTPLLESYDICVQPAEGREKKLLISDMDSTMITVECIDELADYAGIKPKIAEITERAMQGELDFVGALRERVALLRGLNVSDIVRCLEERVRPMPGAETLVKTMAARGAKTILVSGGFTSFAGPVAQQIGFAEHCANVLAIEDEKLTGEVAGEIVDSARKQRLLEEKMTEYGLGAEECVAIGDGANDIPMIERAGLGVAYHAKPKASAAADAAISHGDLTTLLHFQGIPESEWVGS